MFSRRVCRSDRDTFRMPSDADQRLDSTPMWNPTDLISVILVYIYIYILYTNYLVTTWYCDVNDATDSSPRAESVDPRLQGAPGSNNVYYIVT